MRRSSAAGLTAVLLVALATAAAAAAATLAAADGLDADQRRLLGVSMLPNGTEISEPYVPSPPAQDIPLDDGPWVSGGGPLHGGRCPCAPACAPVPSAITACTCCCPGPHCSGMGAGGHPPEPVEQGVCARVLADGR